MIKVPMVATARFTYARRDLAPGDDFEADNERDAKVLETVKKARRAQATIAEVREEREAARAPRPRKNGKYSRRDMTAE